MACYEKLSDWKARFQRRFPSANPEITETAALALNHETQTEMQGASGAAGRQDIVALIDSHSRQQAIGPEAELNVYVSLYALWTGQNPQGIG